MKRFSLSLLCLVIASSFVFGQQLAATVYVENTCISPKMGTMVGWEFGNLFEVGGFYQQCAKGVETEALTPPTCEKEMFGAYVACPVLVGQRTNLKLNIRTGVCNKQNFVISPSVRGSFKATRWAQVTAGVGVRGVSPTLMAGLRINIH
jgi:hypothetical protein